MIADGSEEEKERTLKQYPVLFNGEMVRAILEGRKTQTRRVVKLPSHFKCPVTGRKYPLPVDLWKSTTFGGGGSFRIVRGERVAVPEAPGMWNDKGATLIGSPYSPGDRMWVRETWGYRGGPWHSKTPKVQDFQIAYRADGSQITFSRPAEIFESLAKQRPRKTDEDDWDWQDYISRYWKSWRPSIHMPRWASRITLEITDVRVQRLQKISDSDAMDEGAGATGPLHAELDGDTDEYRNRFRELWESIYAKQGNGWATNPWIWAISFKAVKP